MPEARQPLTQAQVVAAVSAALRTTRMKLNGSIDAESTIPEAFSRIHDRLSRNTDVLEDHTAKLDSLSGVIAEQTRKRAAADAIKRLRAYVRDTPLGRVAWTIAKLIGTLGAGGAIWKYTTELFMK